MQTPFGHSGEDVLKRVLAPCSEVAKVQWWDAHTWAKSKQPVKMEKSRRPSAMRVPLHSTAALGFEANAVAGAFFFLSLLRTARKLRTRPPKEAREPTGEGFSSPDIGGKALGC